MYRNWNFRNLTPAIVLLVSIFLIFAGCSTHGVDVITGEDQIVSRSSSHYNWGYWNVILDEVEGASMIPARAATGHFNIIGFLETGPCLNCITLTNLVWEPTYVEATVQIRHPFPGEPFFTGFDVRGICFLPGSLNLPNLGQTMPNFATDNHIEAMPGQYIGYTDLFNPVTYPYNEPGGYIQGKMSPFPPEALTASLGAFPYYASYPDNGKRNAFETGDIISNTYRIIRETDGTIVFGYSINASWSVPGDPPIIVPDSFPPEANALEAWKVELEIDDSNLNNEGGSLELLVIAYDHQGSEGISQVKVECPALDAGLNIGTLEWEEPENNRKAFSVSIPNTKLTALAGDEVTFAVQVDPMEDITLYAFTGGSATVHNASGGTCPQDVHSEFYGEGVFGNFGNFTIAPWDAAVVTNGARAGEYIMFGNGFAGSMMGSYDVSGLGPLDPNGFVGLIGVGGPSSLECAANTDHVFLTTAYDDGQGDIKIYSTTDPNAIEIIFTGDPVSCMDTTTDEDIWYINNTGSQYVLHRVKLMDQWNWALFPEDDTPILTGYSPLPDIFDIAYEPDTGRVYIYHSHQNGTITVYDVDSTGPPVELPGLEQTGIWGAGVTLNYFKGSFFASGADIEVDQNDADLTGCRILTFANFTNGTTSIKKFDSDLNELASADLSNGPFSTFAISTDTVNRRLVFLPLSDFANDYYLFNEPADW